jgi:hypothetical protein
MRYFGVLVNSEGLPKRPSMTARALLMLSPMPTPRTAGMYLTLDFQVSGNCSFCETT